MINKNKIKKVSIITAIVLGIILVGIFAFYKFFINADYLVFKVTNITNLYEKVKKAEKDTGNLELGEEEVNAVLQTYAKKLEEYKKVEIFGLYSKLEDTNLSIYAPIRYGIIRTVLLSSGEMKFEGNKIIYTPKVFNIGKLKLSKGFVLNKLKAFSNEEITINDNEIYVTKDILPFDVLSLDISDSKITAQIQKVAVNEPSAANGTNQNSTSGGSGQKATAATKQDILKRANRQLNGVRNDVKSSEGKQIISSIQAVVNKMISDPNYGYQSESNAVKARYNQLPGTDRDNIKEAILNNMDTTTMKQIRATFGL